ncbi:uncharacterized protein LOC119112205 [Pollicipes pollicipes]|uniref:uncharacterized protein LOC119112205 n=1 Tax=Pollicipes pollicipes TaxID=41117 RepID=UPI0018849297|nr:uncharacterized protein LOC119112205 [Pollicipes pollicipes]
MTTPRSTFPTALSFTSAFSPNTPTSAPAVLTEAARFFGSNPGPSSLPGSVSTFSRGAPPSALGGQAGAFSFGTTATEASTLVQSIATSPAAAVTPRPTFRPETRRPAPRPTVAADRTSSQRRPASSTSQRAGSGRSLGEAASRGAASRGAASQPAKVPQALGSAPVFEFAQKNGQITRSSHLRGFDTRLPTFREEVVVSDPVFSSADIKPGFSCEGKPYGYYADMANDCRIFHICQPVDVSGDSIFYTRYSFFCGKQTRFDQSMLSCLHDEDAIACSQSVDWLFRNDDFGVEGDLEEQFQADVQSAS